MDTPTRLEPNKMQAANTGNGGAKEEKRCEEQWKEYKAWYSAQPGNRVML